MRSTFVSTAALFFNASHAWCSFVAVLQSNLSVCWRGAFLSLIASRLFHFPFSILHLFFFLHSRPQRRVLYLFTTSVPSLPSPFSLLPSSFSFSFVLAFFLCRDIGFLIKRSVFFCTLFLFSPKYASRSIIIVRLPFRQRVCTLVVQCSLLFCNDTYW